MKDAAAKFARERIAPYVSEMDAKGELHPEILEGLFEHGVSTKQFLVKSIPVSNEVT